MISSSLHPGSAGDCGRLTQSAKLWIYGTTGFWLTLSVCCAHAPAPSPPPPAGTAPPPSDRVIGPPTPSMPRLSSAGITHLMRGLTFFAEGHAAAAIPHLRLALVYDQDSAFIRECLSQAWSASGEEHKAVASLNAGLQIRPEDPGLNLMAGHLAARNRHFARAEKHFRAAMRAEPFLPRAGPVLVDTLLWMGRRDEALNTARQLLAQLPADLDSTLAVAAILEDHAELEVSLATYRHAKQQHPADRTATIGEVRVLELLGRTAEAADSLVSLFAYYPDAPELYVALTRLLRRLDKKEARTYRDEALRQTEHDPQGRLLVALGDLLEGHTEQGLAELQRLLARFPNHAEVRTFAAEQFGLRGDMVSCLRVLKAPAGDPDPYHRTRAWCRSIGGEPQGVIDALERALAAGEKAGDLLQEGARLLANGFTDKTARDYYERLRARLGDHASPEELGLAEAILADASGQGQLAIAKVQAALVHQPREAWLAIRLADLEVRYGDVDAGIAIYERLCTDAPADVDRLNALGFTLADLDRRLSEASVYLRRAYRLAPQNAYVVDSLGWLLYRQGRFGEAIALLERASRSAVNDAEILRHLGDAYHALGRNADACRAYGRARAAFPNRVLRQLLDQRLNECPPTREAS